MSEVAVALGFVEADREQQFLMPPDLRDWVPDDDLSRFIVDVVDHVDLSAFVAGYRLGGRGRRAYAPAMMVGVLLFGYATGVRSSRRLEVACRRDVSMRFITANHCPDHSSIARFRTAHREALEALFVQVLRLAADAGMVDVATVAVDSTKIAGNAAGSRNVTREHVQRRVREIFDEAAAVDAAEDDRYGEGVRGDEPAPGWEAGPGRAERIAEALAKLAEADQADPDLDDDRRARRRGERAGIARADVELAGRPLPPRRQAIEDRQQQREAKGHKRQGPKPQPADPAHPERQATKKAKEKVNLTDPDTRALKAPRGYVQGYSAQAAVVEGQIIVGCELTNRQNDHGVLPGMLAQIRRHLPGRRIGEVLADNGYLSAAENRTTERDHQVRLLIAPISAKRIRDARHQGEPPPVPDTEMGSRFIDPDVQNRYKRRAAIVEPPFGHLKHDRGINRILLRGLAAANTEWSMICTSYNLTKMHTVWATG